MSTGESVRHAAGANSQTSRPNQISHRESGQRWSKPYSRESNCGSHDAILGHWAG